MNDMFDEDKVLYKVKVDDTLTCIVAIDRIKLHNLSKDERDKKVFKLMRKSFREILEKYRLFDDFGQINHGIIHIE